MIVDDRFVTFINSLNQENSKFLNELEKQALESYVPIIRKETQNFLKVLLQLNRPKKILEIGTAVAFSSILMGEYTSSDCKITTIEKYEKRIPIALENIRRAGMENKIELIQGDALEEMRKLNDPFDFIFMDAAKGQYINFLPEVTRLLRNEGSLVSDNVLQDGDVIESRYAVTRRNRTIHGRMREYLYEITHSDELVTTILPIGDGVTLSVKIESSRKNEKN